MHFILFLSYEWDLHISEMFARWHHFAFFIY
jgi:hypothetical protein